MKDYWMGQYRNQHYVPRTHLSAFASKASRRCINLINVRTNHLVSDAPIKSQCSKNNYFKNIEIERWFQNYEVEFSKILNAINLKEKPKTGDLLFLRRYWLLQYLRADFARKLMFMAQKEIHGLIFDDEIQKNRYPIMSEERIGIELLNIFVRGYKILDDLKASIVINSTAEDFIISDNPAIMLNKYNCQKNKTPGRSTGLFSSGLIIILPLNPRITLIAYDDSIYTIPKSQGGFIDIRKLEDVHFFNELQCIRSQDAIFFRNIDQRSSLLAALDRVRTFRRTVWHEIHLAKKVSEDSESNRIEFRVVDNTEEWRDTGHSLINMHQHSLYPRIWFSELKYRIRPTFVETNSALGRLRSTCIEEYFEMERSRKRKTVIFEK